MSTLLQKANQNLIDQALPPTVLEKWQKLTDRLQGLGSAVVAYSGGVDSTLLAYASFLVLGEKSLAVFIESEVETAVQKENAPHWSQQMGFPMLQIASPSLSDADFVANSPRRCYFCKTRVLNVIRNYARENGFAWVLEGQNQDDTQVYRPGRQAVKETGSLSPLAEVGLTKVEIRALCKALKLPVWNLPSSPCLASRFIYGNVITEEGLRRVEAAEDYLYQLGFESVRVRVHNDLARIEVDPEQIPQFLSLHKQVNERLSALGFAYVTLDLKGYRSGSFDQGLKSENSLL